MTNPYPPPPDWADQITTVAVTGTNGKSSTTRFVAAGLEVDAEGPVARVTTVEAGYGEKLGPPPANHDRFLDLMARLRRAGGRRAAIEATSASLGLGFARAWPAAVGVFTNLGNDHLGTHGSFEHVLASKAQLFVNLPPGGTAVLNAGDPHSSLIAEVLPAKVRALWFAGPGAAEDRPVDLRVESVTARWTGLELTLGGRLTPPARIRLEALAAFQAPNFAAALLACVALGLPMAATAEAIAACPPPRGRFEPVRGPAGAPAVMVDYAHTPEALRAALASARELASGRVHLVFGAGGDTDPDKRPALAAEAELADRIWLTSDNPRGEDPREIVAQLLAGLASPAAATCELDRARAITGAIAEAGPDELVLIAGKGHETTQEIEGRRLPFCDRSVARAALWANSPDDEIPEELGRYYLVDVESEVHDGDQEAE